MRRAIQWLDKDVVLAVHQRVLAEHGGTVGLRDEGLLEAALAGPQQLKAYAKPDVFELAAAYAEAICRNHPFVDGNKRVSLVAAALFLECNGYHVRAPEPEAVQMVLGLAAREVNAAQFAGWLRESCKPAN